MTHAGLPRRLGAILYDALLLAAILMIAALAVVMVHGGADETPRALMQALVVVTGFVFYGGFWVRGGQTLGMRAWRLILVRTDGAPPDWNDAARRYFAAYLSWLPAGLGFIWSLVDRERLAWHDRLSGTRLIVIPKSRRGEP